MCGIGGVILTNEARSGVRLAHIRQKLADLANQAIQRGRDSVGFAMLSPNGVINRKWIEPDVRLTPGDFPIDHEHRDAAVVILSRRAEPTTEWVSDKRPDDVHPFTGRGWWAVHNGTIANDKELRRDYDIQTATPIDSAVIPFMLAKCKNAEEIQETLRSKIIGSFALAFFHENDPNVLWLATNYQPLSICYDKNDGALYFASLADYFPSESPTSGILATSVEPYTLMRVSRVNGKFTTEKWSLASQPKKSALVICSAGLDSTTAAGWAKHNGYDVHLLHFLYKCRAESKESAAIPKIAEALGCDYTFIRTDFFKDVIGHSRLTETDAELMKEGDGVASAELAYEWVPARNLVMLSIATAFAEAHGYGYIMLGNNIEESGAYSDNTQLFTKRFRDILPVAVNLGTVVDLLEPVGHLTKREIVALAREVKAPLQYSWSCYESTEKHCGKCGPCFMRRNAFKMNGLIDPQPYAELPDGWWEGCTPWESALVQS